MTRIRTVKELYRLSTFEERFEYLSLRGEVGRSTFGFDRYLNQRFYRSAQWRSIRSEVIARDLGCDLGVPGREIHTNLLIHHMNPITVDSIIDGDMSILDPRYLITTSHRTHNAIHYGDSNLLAKDPKPREPGDTRLW